ncbi:hypothetical protein [Halorhodospira halochloris]|uniref:hypothetical protein n=1 Tax=Halorhodospira halochloris TaxID=1052 RepID=UPI001EE97369|nr:hypothetical protein [Halorhodospira halochloris]MCG5549426.1 hypothetical protein [Halorhodospira halochloris]
MANAINHNVAKGMWEITLFLTALYEYINEHEHLKARNEDFGGYKKTEEEERSFAICFGVKKNIPGAQGDTLEIGIWGYGEMQALEDCYVYISQIADDPELWSRLKEQFNDPPHQITVETDEEWSIALDWPHGQDATAEEIEAAAKEISNKIAVALS